MNDKTYEFIGKVVVSYIVIKLVVTVVNRPLDKSFWKETKKEA